VEDLINSKWKRATTQDFWAEVAPFDHLVQIYENEGEFLKTLCGFVSGGFSANDSVIVIASNQHLQMLNDKLKEKDLNFERHITDQNYFPLEAKQVMSKFMVQGWPNEALFFETINGIFKMAKHKSSRIRAFGEMVAILWQEKNYSATVHLEHLWNKFCEQENFCLYCAYPKTGFTRNPAQSMKNICCTHSKVIAGVQQSTNHIHYLDLA
jgi:hypothetical protein